jgi:hypothetical protein
VTFEVAIVMVKERGKTERRRDTIGKGEGREIEKEACGASCK